MSAADRNPNIPDDFVYETVGQRVRADLDNLIRKIGALRFPPEVISRLAIVQEALELSRAAHECQGEFYDGPCTRALPKLRAAIDLIGSFEAKLAELQPEQGE